MPRGPGGRAQGAVTCRYLRHYERRRMDPEVPPDVAAAANVGAQQQRRSVQRARAADDRARLDGDTHPSGAADAAAARRARRPGFVRLLHALPHLLPARPRPGRSAACMRACGGGNHMRQCAYGRPDAWRKTTRLPRRLKTHDTPRRGCGSTGQGVGVDVDVSVKSLDVPPGVINVTA